VVVQAQLLGAVLWFMVRIGQKHQILFLARCRKRQLNQGQFGFVRFSCLGVLILVFILRVVGLFCRYHSQVIGWKDSFPKWLLCIQWDIKLYTLTLHGMLQLTVVKRICSKNVSLIQWYVQVSYKGVSSCVRQYGSLQVWWMPCINDLPPHAVRVNEWMNEWMNDVFINVW